MKLSRKSEYALLALIDLAEHPPGKLLKTVGIAERKAIPKSYLDKILIQLRHAGYIRSGRGAEGGHELARSPERITVAEVIRLMDGALAPVESVSEAFYGHTPIERQPSLVQLFRDIRDYVAQKLETTTLAELTDFNGGDRSRESPAKR